MDKELKNKWVKALCSGEYEQGAGQLRDGAQFCCLGVLAEISRSRYAGYEALASKRLLDTEIQYELGKVNDAGVPFEVIAGLIDCAL
jgi:hypothetical protein